MRTAHANPLIAILAEDHRLAMFEIEHAVSTHTAVGKVIKCVIVKDVAVLIDLDERDAFVFGGRFDYAAEVFDVDVDGARDEGGLAGNGQCKWIHRVGDG